MGTGICFGISGKDRNGKDYLDFILQSVVESTASSEITEFFGASVATIGESKDRVWREDE